MREDIVIRSEADVHLKITVNDLSVGRSVDETLRLLDAFQFAEKHGEVCPANWNPGADTIKTTGAGNKEYLDKTYGDSLSSKSGAAVNGK